MPVPAPTPEPNTSASGGYLRPAAMPAPLQGAALNTFFQELVVGVTGLAGELVRPAWQAEPPNIPPAAVAWAAIRITMIPGDTFPAVIHRDDGSDELQRHEQINILASFYDLGTDGLADAYARMLRDGLAIPQNREVLTRAGMGLNSVGTLVAVPVLLKERWLYRVDLPFIVAREDKRVYPVENVASMHGELVTSTGDVLELSAEQTP